MYLERTICYAIQLRNYSKIIWVCFLQCLLILFVKHDNLRKKRFLKHDICADCRIINIIFVVNFILRYILELFCINRLLQREDKSHRILLLNFRTYLHARYCDILVSLLRFLKECLTREREFKRVWMFARSSRLSEIGILPLTMWTRTLLGRVLLGEHV